MRSSTARWRTPFGRWVRAYSTRDVAAGITKRLGYSVSQLAIYHWVAGRRAPRPELARAMVQLSRHQISLDDIYQQRIRLAEPHAAQSSCAEICGRVAERVHAATGAR